MTDRQLILALDIATTTGFARGRVGEVPIGGSVRFGKTNASNNAVFAACLKWIAKELEPEPRPQILILELMLSPDAKIGATSRDVRDRLAGLHGVIRAVAHLRGVYEISEAGVAAVRAHFISSSHEKRDRAKALVLDRCEQLGWIANDNNSADAFALWSYCAAVLDPSWALKLSPMFNPELRA